MTAGSAGPSRLRGAIGVLAFLLLAGSAEAAARAWRPPRTAGGRPDLQGVWTNASITKLTRAQGTPLEVDAAAAARTAGADPLRRMTAASAAPIDPNLGAPAAGGDTGASFLDSGESLARIGGRYRMSWLVDPADGQLPLSPEGRRRVAKAQAFAAAAGAPTGPEALQPWDRCLISSRGSGGPGMLNNIYNSQLHIVQTPGAVVVLVEMVHDARVIPLFASKSAAQAEHGPLDRWLGDSVGWWEGDTLVVETTHVHAEQGRAGPIFLTPQGRVTERFTRSGPREIAYAFEVEDPAYYTRPWRAEMVLTTADKPIYEYACHEGNYAIRGILAGARKADRGD